MAKPSITPKPARIFLVSFTAIVVLGLAVIGLAMTSLGAAGLLPPPPLVATDCIDRKFAFLAEQDLSEVDLIAMGSSGAWRDLDMRVFAEELGSRPLNAAPCRIQVHQSAFMTAFLAPRMPALKSVIFVALPRDFENCSTGDAAFFDPNLAGAMMDGRVPLWAPYITGFEATYMVQNVIAKLNRTGNFGVAEFDDGFGSNALLDDLDWAPAWAIDETCFGHLRSLEETVAQNGAQLFVVFAPVQPEWLDAVDPDRVRYAAFEVAIRSQLSAETLVIPPWPDADTTVFSDTQHLRHPHERAFTAYITSQIRTKIDLQSAAG